MDESIDGGANAKATMDAPNVLVAKRPDWASEINKYFPKPIAIELFGEIVEKNMIKNYVDL